MQQLILLYWIQKDTAFSSKHTFPVRWKVMISLFLPTDRLISYIAYLEHIMRNNKYELLQDMIKENLEGRRGRPQITWMEQHHQMIGLSKEEIFHQVVDRESLARIVANVEWRYDILALTRRRNLSGFLRCPNPDRNGHGRGRLLIRYSWWLSLSPSAWSQRYTARRWLGQKYGLNNHALV